MSGHSKWANIKNRKQAEDKKRGKVFSKLARAIAAVVKEGGSADLSANPRLRIIVERARGADMPKDNIERAIASAAKSQQALEEIAIEGYGPFGVAVFVEATTDNRQRTIQELRHLFQKVGGAVAEPGAVAFQFKKRGVVEVVKPKSEETLLSLIDYGAEDFQEEDQKVFIFLPPEKILDFVKKIGESGLSVLSSDVVMKPVSPLMIDDKAKAKTLLSFLDEIEDHDDVQRVFVNFDLPDQIIDSLED